jgi:hypothetical protein
LNWTIKRIFASYEEANLWQKVTKEMTALDHPRLAPTTKNDGKVGHRRKRKKKRKQRKSSREAGYPSNSSTSSSSSSSSSSSESELEDTSGSDSSNDNSVVAWHSSKAKKKAKEKKRTRRKKKDCRNLMCVFGVYPSTKDKKKVFGPSIPGEKIDKAIAFEGVPKERTRSSVRSRGGHRFPTRYVPFKTDA